MTTYSSATTPNAGKKKKWNGASRAPSRPAARISGGRSRAPRCRSSRVGRPAISSRMAPTRIGRPRVVARWTSSPVAITDGMRKYGHAVSPWESYQLLSYELAVTSEIGSP